MWRPNQKKKGREYVFSQYIVDFFVSRSQTHTHAKEKEDNNKRE